MNQRQREKIALVVFIVVLAISACISMWYMSTGRQWSVVANTIDDTAGRLEGYTAILFDGVAVPSADDKDVAATVPVTLTSVTSEYEEKGASVLALDVVHPEGYAQPTILKRGDVRIGVFYVDSLRAPTAIQSQVDYLRAHEVDYVVCIAAQMEYAKGKAEGIDVVISLAPDGAYLKYETTGGTFSCSTPCVGKIATILISPSDIVSAREISQTK